MIDALGGKNMKFWDKLKSGMTNFMSGRSGADQLSLMLVYGALFLNILMAITRLSLFGTLGFACLIWAIFRMFSRNTQKRYAENAAFLAWVRPRLKSAKQWFIRLKNSRQYCYFKCPQCKTLMRLPRKVGEVNVTCKHCGHTFSKKA